MAVITTQGLSGPQLHFVKVLLIPCHTLGIGLQAFQEGDDIDDERVAIRVLPLRAIISKMPLD
jgi:hypothetical protein